MIVSTNFLFFKFRFEGPAGLNRPPPPLGALLGVGEVFSINVSGKAVASFFIMVE